MRTEPTKELPFPYPLPIANPNWRTSTVVGIIKGIQEAGTWDSLPILADALQDAGCDDLDIITHLQSMSTEETRPLDATHTIGWVEPTHRCGKFPNLNGGCWHGTCWVIQLVMDLPQRVKARQDGDDTWYAVLNPGAEDGKVYRVQPYCGTWNPSYFVEAKNLSLAEEEFIDDDDFGKHYRIPAEDLKELEDHNETDAEGRWTGFYHCQFTGSGNPYDGNDISVDGGADDQCDYYGPGIPHHGVQPYRYANRGTCDQCGRFCYPRSRQHRPYRWCCIECRREALAEEKFEQDQL